MYLFTSFNKVEGFQPRDRLTNQALKNNTSYIPPISFAHSNIVTDKFPEAAITLGNVE